MHCTSQRELMNVFKGLLLVRGKETSGSRRTNSDTSFMHCEKKKSTIFFSVAFKISDLNILAGLEAITNLNKFCTR